MPVVPEPPEEEMPRIEIRLVSLASNATPGVKRTMSEKSLMPLASMASRVSTLTLIGTRLSDSSWRVAVTVTSSSTDTPVSASLVVCAWTQLAGTQASRAMARLLPAEAMLRPEHARAFGVGSMVSPWSVALFILSRQCVEPLPRYRIRQLNAGFALGQSKLQGHNIRRSPKHNPSAGASPNSAVRSIRVRGRAHRHAHSLQPHIDT